MKDFIIEYWLEFLFSSGLCFLSFITKMLYSRIKRIGLVEQGMRALLKDRIIQAYNHATKQGFCPICTLECISDMYEQYKALG